MKSRIVVFLAALMALAVSGCWEEKWAAVHLSGFDHGRREDRVVAWFTVEDGRGRRTSFVPGGIMCCAEVPEKWRPGIKFKVRWEYGSEEGPPPPDYVEVELPEYERKDLENLNVHFYPDGRVKAIVSAYGPGSVFYPMLKTDRPPFIPNEDKTESLKKIGLEKYAKSFGYFEPTKKDLEWAKQWLEDNSKEEVK